MRHIVIIGQSVTAVKAIELLRVHDQESRVTMVAFDPALPALTERFPELIARQMNRAQVFYQNENFYHNLRVELMSGKKINRLNLNRRTVFFEDKDRLEADVLILAGAEKNRFPEIKGTNREGVFSLQAIDQVDALLKMIGHIDTIVVQSETMNGARFAQALLAQNKEVILCLPGGGMLPGTLDEASANFIVTLLEQAGVRVLRNSTIQEVLGETDVKAVRLNTGKVIAAEAVVFPDALPDVRVYQKNSPDANQHAGDESVYTIDRLGDQFGLAEQFCFYEEARNAQAQRLSAAMLGQEITEDASPLHVCLAIGGQEICFVGDVSGKDADVFVGQDAQGLLLRRVFLKNNVVLGAVLVNNTTMAERVCCLIRDHEQIDPQLHEVTAGCVKGEPVVDLAQPIQQEEDKAKNETSVSAVDVEPPGEIQA